MCILICLSVLCVCAQKCAVPTVRLKSNVAGPTQTCGSTAAHKFPHTNVHTYILQHTHIFTSQSHPVSRAHLKCLKSQTTLHHIITIFPLCAKICLENIIRTEICTDLRRRRRRRLRDWCRWKCVSVLSHGTCPEYRRWRNKLQSEKRHTIAASYKFAYFWLVPCAARAAPKSFCDHK